MSVFDPKKVIGLCLTLWLPGIGHAQTETLSGWTSPAQWPWESTVRAEPDRAVLVVVETNGVTLDLQLADGTLLDAPGPPRTGPEFLYLAAGTEASYSLTPRFQNDTGGSFRTRRIILDGTTEAPAMQLYQAGIDAASRDRVRMAAACESYVAIARDPAVAEDWRTAAHAMEPYCLFLAGQGMEELSGDPDPDFVAPRFSILPYHTAMMRASLAFAKEAHNQAVTELELALALAETLVVALPDYGRAIRQDMAAMKIDLGMNLMMQVWRSGNAADGGMAAAETMLQEGITEAGELENHMILSEGYDYMAALSFVSGNNKGMIDNLELARNELEISGRDEEQIIILGSIGDYYRNQGELRLALQSYLDAMLKLQVASNPAMGADTYQNLASLYRQLGDLPRARSLAETSKQLWLELGSVRRATTLNREMALMLADNGEYEAARDLLEEQIAFHEQQEEPWEPLRLTSQALLSEIEFKLGNLERAWELSSAAMAKVRERSLGGLFQGVPVFANHALLLQARGETAAAMALIDEALALPGTTPEFMVSLLAAELTIREATGDTDAVIEAAERAFSFIESQRMELESARLGPYFTGRMQGLYRSHAKYLLQRREDEPALVARVFEVIERARASSLRLRRQEMQLAQAEDLPQARDAWHALLAEMDSGVSRAQSDADLVALERNIGEARELYYTSLGFTPVNPPTLSLDAVVAALPAEALLLNFVVGDERLWRFDIDRAGWQLHDLGPAAEIMARIEALYVSVSAPGNTYRDQLGSVSLTLLDGLELDDTTTHLLVSATASMGNVPFSALLLDDGFLGERATLTLVPSISEYFSAGEVDEPARAVELAVFADPDFGSIADPQELLGDEASFHSWSSTLERLPASAREAEALRNWYPEANTRIFTGESANADNLFADEIRNARILHVATHGYFNEALPELTGLAMSPGWENDSFVSLAEISGARFNADLVVISACSTTQGETIPGEGNMSLARAFLAQGVGSVISTLWPVSDRATAEFMREFYRALNEEQLDYAGAMQRAQQVLRNSTNYRNPYYWAGYVLSSAVPSGPAW